MIGVLVAPEVTPRRVPLGGKAPRPAWILVRSPFRATIRQLAYRGVAELKHRTIVLTRAQFSARFYRVDGFYRVDVIVIHIE